MTSSGTRTSTVRSAQAADDGAYYIITRAEPLTVAWIPYCDAYRAPAPWIRGLRKEDFLP